MKEILRKLASRKLWAAIAGVATGIALVLGVDASDLQVVAGAVTTLVSVVTYIVTEGRVDAESVKNAVISIQDAVDVFQDEEAETVEAIEETKTEGDLNG